MATAAIAASMMFALPGCGGGGGSPSPTPTPTPTVTPTPTPTPSSGVSWSQGVFAPASTFEARCENPRSGFDIEGNAFQDLAGSLTEELFWLRSWTEETYLWNDEVTDQNPNNFSDRLAYFAQLKTFATTASGEDKDDFHFSQSTEDYLEQRNSTAQSGYGVEYVAFSTTPPRDFRVLYTEPNSPASNITSGEAPFQRGAKILEVDGIDLVNAGSQADVNGLNAGLFPAVAGETHTFLVQDPGESPRTITITSADVATAPVNRTRVIDTSSGKVGYILFNTFSPFSSEEAIATAISEMKTEGVSDLVLDLRYNGGGLPAVAAQLGYMVAGESQTSGKTFELLQFNDNAGNANPVTGEVNEPVPFIDIGLGFSLTNGTPLDSLDLPRVFILSTGSTCSASEAVINGLRGVDVEVILIGDTTCGKPYGFYPTDNCGETYYTIQFKGVNEKGFGDYSDGFVPDDSSFQFGERLAGCVVADDYDTELGEETEALLAAALDYRETGTCPATASTSGTSSTASASPPQKALKSETTYLGGPEVATTDMTQAQDIMHNNRDMRTPY